MELRRSRKLKRNLQVNVPLTMTYIPINKQIIFLLNNQVIKDYFLEKDLDNEFMTGYKDGDAFKTHILFSKERSIRLNLYYDDLEVANGLRSKFDLRLCQKLQCKLLLSFLLCP
jgi:hypothetical protein